jgi:solute carrier family 25 S-adenosylmethionine transporter 26
VLKQNAQVLTREPGGVNTTIAAFRNLKSMKDLWSGYGALVARNLPYTALQFPVFEMLKARWITKEMGVTEWATWAGVAAGSSGSVAAVLTTPVDVIKTRIMLAAGEQRNVKVGEVVKEVLRKEGFHGLWRGGALRAVWTFAGSGLFLGTYEGSKLWLERRREAKEGVEEKLRL